MRVLVFHKSAFKRQVAVIKHFAVTAPPYNVLFGAQYRRKQEVFVIGNVPEIAQLQRTAQIRRGTQRRRQKARTAFDRRVRVRHKRRIKDRDVFDLDESVAIIDVLVGGVMGDFARFDLPQRRRIVLANVTRRIVTGVQTCALPI